MPTTASAIHAKQSLLCRLLLNMTNIFKGKKEDLIHLPSGVFSVPVSATLMLQVIVKIFLKCIVLTSTTRTISVTFAFCFFV